MITDICHKSLIKKLYIYKMCKTKSKHYWTESPTSRRASLSGCLLRGRNAHCILMWSRTSSKCSMRLRLAEDNYNLDCPLSWLWAETLSVVKTQWTRLLLFLLLVSVRAATSHGCMFLLTFGHWKRLETEYVWPFFCRDLRSFGVIVQLQNLTILLQLL